MTPERFGQVTFVVVGILGIPTGAYFAGKAAAVLLAPFLVSLAHNHLGWTLSANAAGLVHFGIGAAVFLWIVAMGVGACSALWDWLF